MGQLDHKIAGMKEEMGSIKEEILRHFDVTVENIRSDPEGANADEISAIKGKQAQHDERITVLERRSGVI